MNKLLATLFVVFLNLVTCYAQHSDNSLIVDEKRNNWLEIQKNELQDFKPVETTNRLEIKKTKKLSVRVKKDGLIELKNRKWIYIITNSSHTDPEIGDISLAIDNRKNVYYNAGHICGGIIHFETKKLTKLNRPKEFFDYFICDIEGSTWQKIK